MKLTIQKNSRLIDGETYYDEEKIITTKKSISVNMIRKFNDDGWTPIIYIQIGTFLDKDFIEIELTKKDVFYIEEE